MKELSNPILSSLIGSIYDCALDPSLWEQTLAQVAQLLACEKAILSLNELQRNRILIKKSVGWDPYWLAERAKHLPEIHGRLSPWLLCHSDLDTPYIASREIPSGELGASRYVQNCLRPQGIVDVAHFFLISTSAYFSEVVLCWQEPHGIMSDREIEIGMLLLPHLRRAVTISNVLDIRTVECARMTETLDALPQGVVLTNDRGTILHANRSAVQILKNGSPIGISKGALHAKSRAANDELSQAIALAARDESAIGKTGIAICLTEADIRPVFAHVLPMAGGQLRSQLQPAAIAAVFIDAPPDEQNSAVALATAFRLTAAETRLLAQLVVGYTLSEAAIELGIAKTTAKTHLTHIFMKTGVSRQADLMRLAMQAAAPGSARI
ncbi:helix-turn-helix transcriptional regulator [Rhizobium sp. LEGMi135b]